MTKKTLIQILFYGSIWGILEATVGHILHFIPATIAGAIMFPIAGAVLYQAYNRTKSTQSLFYIGIIAAMIKSVNFLLPQLSIYKTINPMISILLESLVVVVVVSFLVSDNKVKKYSALPIASITWRTVFVLWMATLHFTTGLPVPYIGSFNAIFSFVILSGLLSGAIGSLFIYLLNKVQIKLPEFNSNIIFATGLLLVAIFTTYNL